MEVKTVLQLQVVVVLFLLAGLNGARAAVVEKYFVETRNMVLEPNLGPTITNILWKHKGNLLAEWVKDVVELTYYDTFTGRTTLNITTGRLEITKMTKDDAGAYTLEINSKVHGESYAAKMIKEVPKPTVEVQPLVCSHESANCTLLCGGSIPEAEPITYTWRRDEGEWRASEKELMINKDTPSSIQTFSCRMKNPVSTEESEPKDNPFYEPPPPPIPPGPIIAVVVSLLVLFGLAGVGFYKKDAIKNWFNRVAANNNPNTNGESPKPVDVTTEYHAVSRKTEDGEPTRDGAAAGDA